MIGKCFFNPPDQTFRPAINRCQGRGKHCQGGNRGTRLLFVITKTENCLESGQGELIDPQRPVHRILFDSFHYLFLPDNQAGLGPSQQFIAAEGNHIGPGLHHFTNGRLLEQTELGKIEKAAASKILHHREIVFSRKGNQIRQINLGSKTDHAVIAGMHLEQQGRFRTDRHFIITQMRPVGCANLNKLGAAFGHHIRDAERPTDLNELPP
ncbi:MAG: hypothetical protein ACD_74C00093G0001 [uncultured bacterium]|nr:MAG: hypothetical protein ACD_74C00093G0001 [uncultured bacterium]